MGRPGMVSCYYSDAGDDWDFVVGCAGWETELLLATSWIIIFELASSARFQSILWHPVSQEMIAATGDG